MQVGIIQSFGSLNRTKTKTEQNKKTEERWIFLSWSNQLLPPLDIRAPGSQAFTLRPGLTPSAHYSQTFRLNMLNFNFLLNCESAKWLHVLSLRFCWKLLNLSQISQLQTTESILTLWNRKLFIKMLAHKIFRKIWQPSLNAIQK